MRDLCMTGFAPKCKAFGWRKMVAQKVAQKAAGMAQKEDGQLTVGRKCSEAGVTLGSAGR